MGFTSQPGQLATQFRPAGNHPPQQNRPANRSFLPAGRTTQAAAEPAEITFESLEGTAADRRKEKISPDDLIQQALFNLGITYIQASKIARWARKH